LLKKWLNNVTLEMVVVVTAVEMQFTIRTPCLSPASWFSEILNVVAFCKLVVPSLPIKDMGHLRSYEPYLGFNTACIRLATLLMDTLHVLNSWRSWRNMFNNK
jgi:hypothetical protein